MAKTKVESEEEIKDEGSKTILDIIQENIENFNKNTKGGEEPGKYPLILFDTYEDFIEFKKYDKTGANGVGMELANDMYEVIQKQMPMEWEDFLEMLLNNGEGTLNKDCWNTCESMGSAFCVRCINCWSTRYSKNCKDCGNNLLINPSGDNPNQYCNNCINCKSCNYCDNCLDCNDCSYSKQCIGCEDCNKSDDKYCVNCQYCNGCLGCNDCIKCSDECTTCEKCGGCSGCESCIKCRNCVDCTGCEECIGCNSCITCYDCDYSNELEDVQHWYKTWEKDLNNNYLKDYFYFVN